MAKTNAQQKLQTMNIQGDIVLADQNNFYNLTGPGRIAYLCCDDPSKQDNFAISPSKMLNQLMGVNLSAIILFSTKTNWCSFDRNDGPSFSSIVSNLWYKDGPSVEGFSNLSKTLKHARS